MTTLKVASLLALLLASTAAFATQVNASPENANLVRQAIVSGLDWSSLLRDTSDQGLLTALDENDYCEPGKTCVGLTAQLFFGPSCEWSQTAGFVSVFPELYQGSSGCKSTVYPPLSSSYSFDNTSLMWTRFLHNDVKCTGFVIESDSYKTGTCFTSKMQSGVVLWNDAKLAFPLKNSQPAIPDKSAPIDEKFGVACNPSSSAPADAKCDPTLPIITYQKSSRPENPLCDGPNPTTFYLFGEGETNKCYLLNFNVWYSIDTTANTYTITNTAGCDLKNVLNVKTGLLGCNWTQQASYTTSSVRLGTTN